MRNRRTSFKVWLGVLLSASAFTSASQVAQATDSTGYPWLRGNGWVNMPIGTVAHGGSLWSSGHIGIDVWMTNGSINGGADYNPCHVPSDPAHGACTGTGVSYYKVHNYWPIGNTNYPFGIFVDSSNNSVAHDWAKKITGMSAEIYPYGPTVNCGAQPAPCYPYVFEPGDANAVGGVRITATSFDGSGYSGSPGNINLPKYGEAGVVYLNGFATKGGVASGDLTIDVFGQSAVTTRSSTGYPIVSFSSGGSKPDGYYNTGPLLKGSSGNFSVYLGDKATGAKALCTINVPSSGTVVNVNLSDPNYWGLGSGACHWV